MFRNSEPVHVRRMPTDDDVIGGCVIKPKYRVERLFPGWGPRLFAFVAAMGIVYANATHPAGAMQLAQADCGIADRPAAVVDAAQPATPQLDWAPGERTAAVQVDLTPTGAVAGTSIAQSSGVPQFDWEALRVAHQSRYEPAVESCRAIGGSYLYLVTFGN